MHHGLQQAIEQARRAGQIVKRIRAMADKHEPDHELIQLHRLVDDALQLTDAEARAHEIELVRDLPAELPRVAGDAVQLEQVILNLVRNAIDAIAGDPAPHATRRITLSSDKRETGWVHLIVSDTGPGMSQEASAYIFHPFFTTKDEGMGMGLNICESIAEAHAGRLFAEPNNPRCTRFHLALPIPENGN